MQRMLQKMQPIDLNLVKENPLFINDRTVDLNYFILDLSPVN